MEKRRLKFMLSIFMGIGFISAYSQNTIPTAGGSASGSGGNASYTVGQIFYNNNSGTKGSITEGVQQPYEISVVNEIEEAKGIDLKCSVYPNPTVNFLILHIDTKNFANIQNMSYQLFDLKGNLISKNIITDTDTKISILTHPKGSYFLKVVNNNLTLKTFKVIKN